MTFRLKRENKEWLTCRAAYSEEQPSSVRAYISVGFLPPSLPISPRGLCFLIQNYYWNLALLEPWPCSRWWALHWRRDENIFLTIYLVSVSLFFALSITAYHHFLCVVLFLRCIYDKRFLSKWLYRIMMK